MPRTSLLAAIADRSLKVGVLGLGHAGLPLAGVFARAGYRVLGFDTEVAKVETLRAGRAVHDHLADCVDALVASGRFEAPHAHERLSELDALMICVPTPLGQHREPDLTHVEEAADAAARALRTGQLVVLC